MKVACEITTILSQVRNAQLKIHTYDAMNPMSFTVFLICSGVTSALSYSTVPCLSAGDTVTFIAPFISPTVDSIRLTHE